MRFQKVLGWSSALCLSASIVQAQETNELEMLRKEMREMRETMRQMEQKIESLEQKPPATAAVPVATPVTAAPETAPGLVAKAWSPTDPIRIGSARAFVDLSFDGLFAAGGSTADDIEGGTQLGGHDPTQRSFTVQNLEVTFAGAVDPYFRGQANLVFLVDSGGGSLVEAEEAFAETTSLPANLQVKAGQFFTEFGRLNPVHPHAWSFVDQPLVNGRFLGPDGLRNAGARLSWLMPLPFYSELFLAVQNSHGETAASFRSAGHAHGGEEEEEGLPFAFRHPDNDRGVNGVEDLLFTPRWATSFDLTDNQVLLLGASAVIGPNSRGGEGAGNTWTQIYGVDLTWKWKSPNAHAGFPFVMWQTEAMLRRYEAGMFDWDEEGNGGDGDGNTFPDEGVLVDASGAAPAVLNGETLTDYGFYTQFLYGFRKGWVAGMRFDYVTGERGDYENAALLLADNAGGGTPVGRDPLRNQRWRISPNLTWYPSEFSKLRLQYNYDDRRGMGVDHSVWLQFEFLLGSHGAHKF